MNLTLVIHYTTDPIWWPRTRTTIANHCSALSPRQL